MANVALSNQDSLAWVDDTWTIPSEVANLIVTTDGGFRGRRSGSSAAWIVWHVSCKDKTISPISINYCFWQHGRSAFEAETVALDSACASRMGLLALNT